MNRLSKAANEVMSRIVGLKPTPMQPFTHGLSTPDTTPRKPRKVHRFGPWSWTASRKARPSRWRRE